MVDLLFCFIVNVSVVIIGVCIEPKVVIIGLCIELKKCIFLFTQSRYKCCMTTGAASQHTMCSKNKYRYAIEERKER
uniref:Uncharacterized protein n=1 Tax=Picea sitchensis TaxID=3332 RepID=D5AB24_PICSI|nr:unknown [Picea sitchensis]